MKSIHSRIEHLKAKIPTPLIVICKLPTGEESRLTVDECIKQMGYPIRTQGGNINDACKLLNYMAGQDCVID